MNRYTLDQIALFDRCLFPEDFRKKMIELGADEGDASEIYRMIITHRSKGGNIGIIQIYQEYSSDEKLAGIFDKMVLELVSVK